MELLGHRVVGAVADGRSLLELSSNVQGDLALVDFDMPLLDGLAAAEELSRSQGIPVILISGHPDLEHVVWEQEFVARVVRKPFSIEQLDEAIRTVLQDPSH